MGRAQKCLIGAQMDQNGSPIDPNDEFWESSLESVTRGGCAANTNNPIKMGHFRHNSHNQANNLETFCRSRQSVVNGVGVVAVVAVAARVAVERAVKSFAQKSAC